MQYLDPSWLNVELEAIQKEQMHWDDSLRASYDAAVQRVFAYQERVSSEMKNADQLANAASR